MPSLSPPAPTTEMPLSSRPLLRPWTLISSMALMGVRSHRPLSRLMPLPRNSNRVRLDHGVHISMHFGRKSSEVDLYSDCC
jgi:hypothetical protein